MGIPDEIAWLVVASKTGIDWPDAEELCALDMVGCALARRSVWLPFILAKTPFAPDDVAALRAAELCSVGVGIALTGRCEWLWPPVASLLGGC